MVTVKPGIVLMVAAAKYQIRRAGEAKSPIWAQLRAQGILAGNCRYSFGGTADSLDVAVERDRYTNPHTELVHVTEAEVRAFLGLE